MSSTTFERALTVQQRVGGFSEERINGEDADLALRLGVALALSRSLLQQCFHTGSVPEHEEDLKRTFVGACSKVCAEIARWRCAEH